jgi:adenosylhomocysteine nucleosidase
MEALAFVCAMPMELRPLSKRLGLTAVTVRGVRLRSGTLDGRPVVALATGMGPTLATQSTARLLDAADVDRVLVFGITGAVDDVIPIGAVVHPALVVDGETGAEHRPDRLGGPDPAGTMWTTDRITRPAELPALRARGVVCLDMETAAIAASCERQAIPWSVHRAISDRATDGSVDDEVFHLSHQDGTPDHRAVAAYLLRHPQRIPGLVRMAKGARLATERAADAAIDAARTLR